jgi:hypothetical protein
LEEIKEGHKENVDRDTEKIKSMERWRLTFNQRTQHQTSEEGHAPRQQKPEEQGVQGNEKAKQHPPPRMVTESKTDQQPAAQQAKKDNTFLTVLKFDYKKQRKGSVKRLALLTSFSRIRKKPQGKPHNVGSVLTSLCSEYPPREFTCMNCGATVKVIDSANPSVC